MKRSTGTAPQPPPAESAPRRAAPPEPGGPAPQPPTVPPKGWPTPRAAYIHVPFCRHRCGYCNFSVLAGRDDRADDFLKALEAELQRLGQPQEVDTRFIGGGTPTHLPAPWLARLLELVGRWFPLSPQGEFSVEANPGDIDPLRLETLRAAGVNRLSLGVQSFQAEKLRRLERDHTPAAARQAVLAAAEVIPNVSIDLIFAAPGETPAQWQTDLDAALALPLAHLSTYNLTYEKGTRFWSRLRRGQCSGATEADELAMYQAAIDAAQAAGMEHYEVSNFARPGFRCRHNVAYWEGRGWWAAGPSAARFVEGRREVNHRSPTRYLQRALAGDDPTAEIDRLSPEQWAREQVAFGLRMRGGVDLQRIAQESGIAIAALLQPLIGEAIDLGLLQRRSTAEADRLQLTDRGLLLSDSLVARILG